MEWPRLVVSGGLSNDDQRKEAERLIYEWLTKGQIFRY
jgi:hypothetical protein